MLSKKSVPFIIFFVSFTIPPIWILLILSCKIPRTLSPIFLLNRIATQTPIVINPIPPIWIRIKMISCPKKDQCRYVSCTTSPVTQDADVEVNNASAKDVIFPSLDETGSIKRILPKRINNKYPTTIICVCVIFLYITVICFVSFLLYIFLPLSLFYPSSEKCRVHASDAIRRSAESSGSM